jgi:DNA-binding PadR family transcriptional regulator
MPKGGYLGEFEQLILLAVLRLGNDAYGVPIRQEIERCTARSPAIGAVYATLDRLERKGFVDSQVGDPTPARGGRAKRFYRVRPVGVLALRQSQEAVRSMMRGLNLAWR